MNFGIDMINAGYFANPRNAVRLAQAAEAHGWDGFFMWDHLAFIWNGPSGDPWVTLGAVAASTKRLRLGPAVTPSARRRPQVLAQHLVSLDWLSDGRTIFGVGLGGVPQEFSAFGQPFEPKPIAAMLDEGLDVITRLWTGDPVTHHGAYYHVEQVTFLPKPVQQPRIPIWVGGESRAALRRAARWDGWIVGTHDAEGHIARTPEQIADDVNFIQAHRPDPDTSFEIAVIAQCEPGDTALVREYAQAGATWWLESIHEMRGTPEMLLARVEAGPAAV